MKYNLFLDDERQVYDVKWLVLPQDNTWIVARSYGEFVDTIEQLGMPEVVSFDHDLADIHYKVGSLENENHIWRHPEEVINYDYGAEKTGFDAAKWLCGHCMQYNLAFPKFIIHSLNAVGGTRINDYIEFCKTKGGMK